MDKAATTDRRSVVNSDPEIMGGTPIFVGTRVPVRNLIDYLEAGDSLETFLDAFPSVSREQAVAALELAGDFLTASAAYSPEEFRAVAARWQQHFQGRSFKSTAALIRKDRER